MTRPATRRERLIAETAAAEAAREATVRTRQAVTAAATPYKADEATGKWRLRKREGWQDDVFAYVPASPELSFAERYVSSAFSKLRLFPAVQPDLEREPVPYDAPESPLTPTERQQVGTEFARFRSDRGGQARIVERLGQQLFLVGECWLIGKPAVAPDPVLLTGTVPDSLGTQAESWEVLSVSELVEENGRLYEADDQGEKTPLPAGTLVVRVHEEGVQYRKRARSSVQAVLDAVEELAILSRAIRATGKSRIAQNSILGIPHEVSGPPPTDPDTGLPTGQPSVLAAQVMEHFIVPIGDEGSASAAAPFIIEGPADALKAMKDSVITLERPLDPVMAAQRLELRTTIATGIDLPAEVLTGVADVNHWNTWAIDEQKFRDHLEPRCLSMVDALTLGWLRAALTVPLQDGGWGWTQERADLLMVWFDASALLAQPDLAADADAAFDRGALSWSSYRRVKRLSEDDAPTPRSSLSGHGSATAGRPAGLPPRRSAPGPS